MSYYKRATVFLALSRSRPALADLDKVIQLKNDFMAVSLLVLMENWGCNSDRNVKKIAKKIVENNCGKNCEISWGQNRGKNWAKN